MLLLGNEDPWSVLVGTLYAYLETKAIDWLHQVATFFLPTTWFAASRTSDTNHDVVLRSAAANML
jgi:hypothetical protein